MTKDTFFSKDKSFYKALFSMLLIVALQNIVTYSVNMADNIMLGSYNQFALSGAATVNQIFFIIQQFALSFGNALVAISAQYWAQRRTGPIRNLCGIAIKLGGAVGIFLTILCFVIPRPLVSLFTTDTAIIDQGVEYLSIIRWTFILFIITQILMAGLRAVGTVKISFYVSLISLAVNVGINYVLIFGKLGFPEMGVTGAAIGTLIARAIELIIVVIYIACVDKKLKLFQKDFLKGTRELWHDYIKIYIPIMFASVLWGFSVPVQTAILGHLSDDAIAANSVATTFYQYAKVVVMAMSSTSAVMIGQAVGQGNMQAIKQKARSLSVIDVSLGVLMALIMLVLKDPLLSLYNLSDSTMQLASNLILIMCIIMIGMSYQMPVSFGIIQGAGDAKFTSRMNLICTWLIVIPFSFMAAFWWKLPVEWVVVVVQSDQIFKALPTFLHFRKYNWVKKLTRDEKINE